MKFILSALITIFICQGAVAQNIISSKKIKPGKCYKRCFYYNKPIELEEVDCKNSKTQNSNSVNIFDIKKTEKEKIKFIKYQEKLISLGYKLKANGFLDSSTVFAHNKYIRLKKRHARKAKRKNRNKL